MSKAIKGRYYEYKSKVYFVVQVCKMKAPETGEWVDSVLYEDVREGCAQPNLYCRELKDFESKFIKGIFSF